METLYLRQAVERFLNECNGHTASPAFIAAMETLKYDLLNTTYFHSAVARFFEAASGQTTAIQINVSLGRLAGVYETDMHYQLAAAAV